MLPSFLHMRAPGSFGQGSPMGTFTPKTIWPSSPVSKSSALLAGLAWMCTNMLSLLTARTCRANSWMARLSSLKEWFLLPSATEELLPSRKNR